MDTRHKRRKQRISCDAPCCLMNGKSLADEATSVGEPSQEAQNGCITGLKNDESTCEITSTDVSSKPELLLNKFPFDKVDINTLFKANKPCKSIMNDETNIVNPYKENVWENRNHHSEGLANIPNGPKDEPIVYATTCQIPNGLLINDMQPFVVVNIDMWHNSEFGLNIRNNNEECGSNKALLDFTENLAGKNGSSSKTFVSRDTHAMKSRNKIRESVLDSPQLEVFTKCTLIKKEENRRSIRSIKSNENFFRDFVLQGYPLRRNTNFLNTKESINRDANSFIETSPHMNPTVALVRSGLPSPLNPNINKKKYECKKCLKSFVTRSYPRLHDKYVHMNIRDFPCGMCSSRFHTNDSLSKHVACVHLKLKLFECPFCKKRFSVKQQMKRHKRDFHNGGSKFICDICSSSFKRKQALVIHFNVHDKLRKFHCDICSMNFKFKSHLKGHISGVHLKIKHSCMLCSKKFVSRTNMLHHKRSVHHKQKPYECKLCGEKYTSRSYMNLHIRSVHEKQRPYQCDICKHKSKLRAHLSSHLRFVHERQRKFHCQICGSQFGTKTNLRVHLQSVHNKMKYECQVCEKIFRLKGALFKHVQKDHDMLRSCGLCYKKLSTPGCLKNHITKVHTFFN